MASQLIGAKELSRKLQKLEGAAAGKALRNAANFAVTPVLKAAESSAPYGDEGHNTYKGRFVAPGFLSRSIAKRSYLWKNRKGISVWVGMKPEAWYGGMIETGWRPGKRSKAIKSASRKVLGGLSRKALDSLGDTRGDVPAKPWLEPAFERNQSRVLKRFQEKLAKNIKKAAR